MRKYIILAAVLIFFVIGGLVVYNQSKNIREEQSSTGKQVDIQGMKVEILKQGSGPEAKIGNIVTTHYSGFFENGAKFDSSIDRQEPFSFTLGAGKVIKGWELGVVGMKVGEKRKLIIPPELAYGAEGIPGFMPSNATLIFEVELLEIK